ncbi:TPA: heavy metal sensor histidine kinase [Burkholderia aenigmatica]|uniref:heavy metal sensor histidine kinase n=1 Tax=Burkholderia sp. AU45251 TaxID=3059204 RepID=UPI00264AECFA|nr:heavy metal sensor histidine kinase [Burkholderia sp. AU45251]HDR9487581.1 heavy metal sensor histidine kinase [Burkholderia aenigmatica]MDN7520440.1 heavy metal sensor histidine kinase [Burkholderia sp. AU45251]HDR9519359.1 heavy metal sensor histidine kinase [Burkholderia aenigmatica]HDR9596389.1 heavy metal sensor histidine kinase [Burkholderia aenigmatica]HDR9603644.1 heavy metal sensor histidine kinase [Burkholderia aenigmatica]
MTTSPASYSLLRRLTLAFAVVAALVFALTGAYLYRSLSAELTRRDDIEISGKLNQFLQLARASGSIAALRADPAVFHEVLLSHPGVYLGIYDAQNRALVEHSDEAGNTLASVISAPHPASRASRPFTCSPPGIGTSRCVYARATLPSGDAIQVALARTATDRQSLLESYRVDIWLAAALGALLVGALGYAVASRGLRPVKSLGRQTSRIEAHNLNARLDARGGPVELHELATSVNRMLDRLERAFVRLSQFSSDLAHDMRTPLANVISSSQVTLSRARTTEEYEALIDSNIEECERLQRMIENMLFLARTDNARQHLKTAELDAGSELRRLASYFQALADEAGVRIDVHGEAPVVADATLFRRAVSNLASNALEHAEAASTIELAVSTQAGYAVVEVTNRGAAIPPEQVDKIFERFYRIDSSRHGAARNAGLGLAIVKSIMELHRGKVEVASRDGRTTFALYFPRGAAG